MNRAHAAAAASAAFLTLAGAAPPPLADRVEAILAAAGPGARFGMVVAGEDGREIVAIAPEGRFVPASTTKMFTIAAAFARLPSLDVPDAAGGAALWLEPKRGHPPDLVLEGHGDARLSSAGECVEDCLARLADAVAAAHVRTVGDVIGDDSAFPDQRWSPGMSWNNMSSESGTAVSALTLDDNVVALDVAPTVIGLPPRAAAGYFEIRNDALTGAAGTKSTLEAERLPGSRTLRLTGAVPAGAAAQRLRLGLDDPADYTAWRLKALLEARKVKVTGRVRVRHRPAGTAVPVPPVARTLIARLAPPPLALDLADTAKRSQNLHAELFLRRLSPSGGTAEGLQAVRALLDAAGVPAWQAEFADGSGMSTYNRVSPRGVVTFLRWAGRQPWGAAWRATLPVGGVDGTLRRRFKGGPLDGRIFAKTGTLNQVHALAGYLTARSGRSFAFALYANDVPEGAPAARAIDAALELVANEN